MKKLLFLSLSVILVFACCQPNDDCCVTPAIGDFEVNFTTKTQNGNMILFQNFNLSDGTLLNINKLQFYISDIRLLQGGEETSISEVDLVTLKSHSNAAAAAAGETLTFNDINAGSYTGIKFGIGVSTDLNAKDPTHYAGLEGDHILGSGIDYWSGWSSYIFAKIEGYFDANGNGTAGGGDDAEEITYHTGIDELYREKTINTNFDITENDVFTLPLVIDIDKIFNSTVTIDILNESVAHSNPLLENNMLITNKIADNFVEAIGE